MMTDTSDSQTIPAISSASKDAATDGLFWNEIAERLRRFIRGRVQDTHAAEDLVQDVILKAQLNLPSAPMHKLSAWIFQIARNVVIDHYRSRKVRKTVSLDEETASAESEAAIVTELSGCIRPMLARLPDDFRQALEKTDLGELTQAELAERLGLSLPGMKSRVQRGREHLRRLLISCCAPQTGEDGSVVSHSCDCKPPDYCSRKSGKC